MSVYTNRQRELSLLNQRSARPKAEFVVIYGRCRIGKSELIDQFINNRGFKPLHVEKDSLSFAEVFSHFGIPFAASYPSSHVLEVISDMGLAVASFDRAHEPPGISTIEWGILDRR